MIKRAKRLNMSGYECSTTPYSARNFGVQRLSLVGSGLSWSCSALTRRETALDEERGALWPAVAAVASPGRANEEWTVREAGGVRELWGWNTQSFSLPFRMARCLNIRSCFSLRSLSRLASWMLSSATVPSPATASSRSSTWTMIPGQQRARVALGRERTDANKRASTSRSFLLQHSLTIPQYFRDQYVPQRYPSCLH